MLDLTTGQMLRDVSVVITGDRITAINPASPPSGARVMDLGDVTLLPGFIDLHTHLSGEIGANTFIEPVLETSVDAAYKGTSEARSRWRWARR
jgi:imidazolonepropionase-like amidohydrolase